MTDTSKMCSKIHNISNKMERISFPFDKSKIPFNGIYILFEKDETSHGADRIVRVGTHTGDNQLSSRLLQHFLVENKDRSIFRKNIGRAILNRDNDSFLEKWNLDLTTRLMKDLHSKSIDMKKQNDVERKVTEYMQNSFSFVVFRIDDKDTRLNLESKLISTVSLCEECTPSHKWLGNSSPIEKIRESGLWLVNELYKEPFSEEDLALLISLTKANA